MDLIFVGHRCCDHSPSSGYDQVCTLFPAAGWLHGPDLATGRLTWLRRPVTPHTDLTRALFHVFYGDCSGSALPAILRTRFPRATIVSTVHQPVSRLTADPSGWASLAPVDAVIAVARTQASQLAGRGVGAPVHHVPHGVWTRAFRPPSPTTSAPEHVLLVGNYLRDWRAAQHVVDRLAAAGVASLVLGSAAPARIAVTDPLVQIRPHVPETELAACYHRAAALVLPVLDATASNALLEAMAAGCPVICPDLPSLVDEYLGDDSDAYPPGRPEVAVARALSYLRSPRRRAARSRMLIDRSAQFDWARLRPRLADTYRRVRRGGAERRSVR